MDSQTAIDLGRDALWVSLLVSAPLLLAALVVGLAIGLLQALTQIQEQTVAFVPKLIALVVVLALALPWLLDQLMEYSRHLILQIPETLVTVMQFAAGLLWFFEPGRLMLFVLVLSRVSGLVMIAPVFGSADVPMRLRAFFAILLTLLVAPLQVGVAPPPAVTLLDFATYVAVEIGLGFVLGLGIWIHLQAFQLAGQMISQASGMSLADVFLPSLDTSIPVLSHLLDLCAVAVFLAAGGHRLAMEGFLQTFAAIPPGHGVIGAEMTHTLTTLMTQSFQLGIRVAAPALGALLLATVVLGLVGRTLPQLNIVALGFGLNAMVALGVTSLSLGAAAWALEAELTTAIDSLLRGMVSGE